MEYSSNKQFNTIAAISDIHSNVFALKAVLADIRHRDIDQIVNLGDILYGPIAPKATYELLTKYQDDIITIRGNQDRQIYEATTVEMKSNSTLAFIAKDLPEMAIRWMQNLPFDYHLNEDIYLCHGSPADDMIYLLENIETGQPMLRNNTDILASLKGIDSPVIVCGHTHIPRTVMLSTGQIVLIQVALDIPPIKMIYQSCIKCRLIRPMPVTLLLNVLKTNKVNIGKLSTLECLTIMKQRLNWL